MCIEPFPVLLRKMGLELTRGPTPTLQVNLGLLCNQACRHCHLEANPQSREMMSLETMTEVVLYARRGGFRVVDITGGAPEMHPRLGELISKLSSIVPRIMLRSNLTALSDQARKSILDLCREYRVVIVASLPSLNALQTDSQRGQGVWESSLEMLLKLNSMGYGHGESGLELHLVSNPTGAFLPAPQAQLEKRYRGDLQRKWGIVFNNLYAFANSPLGRFRSWLEKSGNLEKYMQKLASSFNPCTIQGLMCRTLLSVSWDGYLYDCDFNLAAGLYMGGFKRYVATMEGAPLPGSPIAVSNHCYACTAGTGFT